MTTLARTLLYSLVFVSAACAAPVGICLHAYSPEAPAEKIECFEFERSEKMTSGTRFFLPNGNTTVITDYRNRGVVTYPQNQPTAPDAWDSTLAAFEKRAGETPSTRPYLNPWILKIRNMKAETLKQQEALSKLPNIPLPDGTVLKGCKTTTNDGEFVSIMHTEGIRKLRISDLSKSTKTALGLDSLPDATKEAEQQATPAANIRSESAPADSAGPQETPQPVSPSFSKPTPAAIDNIKKASPRDAKARIELLNKLANLGDPSSQLMLGLCYEEGYGVDEDTYDAGRWYRRAAEQGNDVAQWRLGIQLVPDNDDIQTLMWFELSAAAGNKDGIKCRDAFSKQLTASQIQEAKRKARQWKPKSETSRQW